MITDPQIRRLGRFSYEASVKAIDFRTCRTTTTTVRRFTEKGARKWIEWAMKPVEIIDLDAAEALDG